MKQQPKFETRIADRYTDFFVSAQLNDASEILNVVRFSPVIGVADKPEFVIRPNFKLLNVGFKSIKDMFRSRFAIQGFEKLKLNPTRIEQLAVE